MSLRRSLTVVATMATTLAVTGCGSTDDGPPADPGPRATAEEVTIPADGLELEGTLRLPAGRPPHPAVVIVHGSGPQSRDGAAPGQLGLTLPRPVPVYRTLAEGLQGRGYAVLTWDKRTCGPSNGCADNGYPVPPDDLTFDTFVDDAAAALDLLADRDDVDGLVLVGHSQGGTIAADLLDHDGVTAAVLVATPAVAIEQVLATQADTLTDLLEAAGQAGTPAAEQARAETVALADEVAAVADGADDGPLVGGASRAFWASWIDASRAAPDRVAASPVPVLALGGGRDWNVTPDQVEAWSPHLPAHGRVEILPTLTHALTELHADDPSRITPRDVATEVAPQVVGTIADWLEATVQPTRSDDPAGR